jgi:hypothetical protein
MGERVSSDDLAALLFRERCFILDGLMTFSCERVADAVILLSFVVHGLIGMSSSSGAANLPSVIFPVFLPNLAREDPSQEKGFLPSSLLLPMSLQLTP